MKVYKAIDNYKNDYCNNTNLVLISDKIKIAEGFFNRLFGLIFKKQLSSSEGLLFENNNSIHTMGMRYCIDAAFLNKSNEVIAIFRSLKPFRFTPFIKGASKVLEFNSGFIESASLEVGDILYLVK